METLNRAWTYRLLPLLFLCGVDGIMIFGDVQVQEMLVWEVLVALGASVQMHLLVVHVIFVEGCKRQWAVGRKRAFHDGGAVGHSTVRVQMDDLHIHRLLSRWGELQIF